VTTVTDAGLDIGIFMSSLGLVRGGLESWALHVAGGLASRGHRVTVVAGRWPEGPARGDLGPVRLVRVPCVPLTWSAWQRMSGHPGWPLLGQSLSFVTACHLIPAVRSLIAHADVTVTAFEAETVLVSRWRARHARPNVSYFPGMIDRRWLKRDRSTVRAAPSETVAQRSRAEEGLAVEAVVYPGVSDELLHAPYQVRPRADALTFVGRLEESKGLLLLLQIFRALAAERPQLRLRLIGDGSLRPHLEERARSLGLEGHVVFLGSISHDGLRHELAKSDLFVFPSPYESFGMALLEAQAAGVPVVASDLPATRESVGSPASLIPTRDLRDWVRALRELLDDRPARERMSREGRARAWAFTWARTAEAMERCCRLALDLSRA
jgi:glycosyltransferase involved in cell wall biosynthesis